MMALPIKTYIKKLLKIVSQMQNDYPNKKFTLDGRLLSICKGWIIQNFGRISNRDF